MAIFKYIVANTEGKKLSGTVEAPDEKIARQELNNLGFSILELTETTETPQTQSDLGKFFFEAIDKNSKLVSGTIPASDEEDAFKKLHQEYSLTVTGIWKEGAGEEEIKAARQKWTKQIQDELLEAGEQFAKDQQENLAKEKEDAFFRNKIEIVLSNVNKLLSEFENEFDKSQKLEINKKVNKLLRIKNSTNLKYIVLTAEELLEFIRQQESYLREKGHQEKRLELQIKTRNLLDELHKKPRPQSLSEDIIQKIENWEKSQSNKKQQGDTNKILKNLLLKTKEIFSTKPELMVIKQQIKIYNKQLWDFTKLYFKEPTPEYKAKVKESIKTVWRARKKAIHSLKQAKILLKERKQSAKKEDGLMSTFIEELNAFSGWLLALYIIYYFVSLYLTTKNFGITEIPSGFHVYQSHIFKYILGILFILHTTTSLKVNFFPKNLIANIALPIIFVFGSIIVLLNF